MWKKIINDSQDSLMLYVTYFYVPDSLSIQLHLCWPFLLSAVFYCLSKTACLSARLSLSLFLCWLDRSVSLSICISACLPCLWVSENEVKLGEDVWWSRKNSWCMTPSAQAGRRAVSRPVHCLAFVCDISSVPHGFTVRRWFTRLTALPLRLQRSLPLHVRSR